jgi:hypothetical protein
VRGRLVLKTEAIISEGAKARQVIRKGNQAGATVPILAQLSTKTRDEIAKMAGVSGTLPLQGTSGH